MKKHVKSDNGKGTLRGFVGMMVAILAVVVLVCQATPTFAFEFNTDELQEIADKASDRWEDLKKDLKEKADDLIDKVPAVGDLVQVDNSIGDKSYSFSLIDTLATDIELKIGEDITELEAEVEQLEQTIGNQRKEIESHANEIARLNAEVTTLKSITTFAGLLALGLIIYLVAILAGALAKIEKLQAKINQQDQSTPDKESPINLKKGLRPRDGDEQ